MYRYGQMVASHPWPFVVLPLLVFGGLGAGLMKVETASKTDDIFLSRHSQGFKDRATVKDLFPDRTRDFYDALELNEEQIMGSIIFMARDNQSVYDPDVVSEIRDIITKVKVNVTVKVGDQVLIYEDLCGRHDNSCVVTGERLLAPQFNAMREMGILTYPKWRLPTTNASVDLSFALADSDKHLKRVGVVRVTFKLRHDLKKESFAWEDAFVKFVQGLETNNTDIAFSSSQSFRQELYSDFTGDLLFFWVCLGLVAFCACVVCTGCDVVSTRTLLTLSGVLSSGAGTVGAFGVLSFCGIKIVEMTWVTPLLVLSMGLGHTFLLMSSWSDTLSDTELHVPQRVGVTLTMAGVGITVTSLSVSTAFAIGYTSSFMVVSNFSLYAGVALAFCYITTMTFTVGCLALHGHRVYSSRHCCTCCATKPRDQLRKEGRLLCTSLVCGGSIPKEKGGDHSLLERLTQKILKTAVNSVAGKVVVVLLFLGYLGVSIYGVTNLEQRVDLKKLVSRSSYFHKYISWDSEYFGFSFPVAFYIKTGVMYNESTANKMERLISRAKKDGDVDEEFERCWLTDFVKSDFYNASESGAEFNGPAGEFNGSAVESFLVETKTYLGDVVMDETGEVIVASRCFVFSQKVSDQSELAGLTGRMRAVAKGSGLPLIVVSLATLNAVSVLVGIFGFTYFWDISLTVFTMNHLIISAGFAVLSSVP
nr:hypothetical protein BaRGS_015899 [Batillaria attramentaria]